MKKPSPALAVALLALFVALGGTSWAALTITGKNVKNSSLTGQDVKNSSLTTSDVRNRSLLAADFKTGQLPAGVQGAQGAQGPPGSQGSQGGKGDKGDTGAAGATNVQGVNGSTVTVPAAGSATASVSCPAGERATGGGGFAVTDSLVLTRSIPFPSPGTPNGWAVHFKDTGGAGGDIFASVVCASP